ncbi:hypothetical protein [Bartonella sp. TT29SHDZB]|uniref:hypothetical protein n=1 Tax=Bartonella sp. TT29SHDZB TaxID=3243581 RepID=UPI0035D07155
MSASLIIGMLIAVGTAIFICSAIFMVFLSTVVTIVALYYSLIKRTILLLVTQRKLKKGAAQNLGHYQVEGRGQRTVLATQLRAFSFQESLLLSKKDYCIIFFLAFILMMLFVGLIAFFAFFPKSAVFLHNYVPMIVLHIIDFVMRLLFWVWTCIVVSLPVILILHSLLQYGVQETVKELETFV